VGVERYETAVWPRVVVLIVYLLMIVAVIFFGQRAAHAHDIYAGVHGKNGRLCCGGDDCARTIYHETGSVFGFLTRSCYRAQSATTGIDRSDSSANRPPATGVGRKRNGGFRAILGESGRSMRTSRAAQFDPELQFLVGFPEEMAQIAAVPEVLRGASAAPKSGRHRDAGFRPTDMLD
jgi:hypothetical protein